jgi:hypothetical protein
MVMKRYISDARMRKERPIPVKITRSVGLQVHMGPVVSPRVFYYSAGQSTDSQCVVCGLHMDFELVFVFVCDFIPCVSFSSTFLSFCSTKY